MKKPFSYTCGFRGGRRADISNYFHGVPGPRDYAALPSTADADSGMEKQTFFLGIPLTKPTATPDEATVRSPKCRNTERPRQASTGLVTSGIVISLFHLGRPQQASASIPRPRLVCRSPHRVA